MGRHEVRARAARQRRRRRQMADLRRGVDVAALHAVSECGGFVDAGGRPVPLLRPKDPGIDQMEFDRRVCAAGVKAFVRVRLADDFPPGVEPPGGYTLVRECASGVRLRCDVAVCWPGRN
jgi:hypothetical protein